MTDKAKSAMIIGAILFVGGGLAAFASHRAYASANYMNQLRGTLSGGSGVDLNGAGAALVWTIVCAVICAAGAVLLLVQLVNRAKKR